MPVPAVETKNLTLVYPGGRTALDDVSVDIPQGRVVGLLGPNGSGKSTLFRVLATLLPPTTGSARVFGHDVVSGRLQVRRHFAVIFQKPALDGELTARENLACHGSLYGLSSSEIRERTARLLEAVEMTDRADEPTKRLSGGMRRRIEISKALMTRPPLLLMDEPTVGLDPAARRQVWKLLGRLRDAESNPSLTILVTTHLLDEAEACDELILLSDGKTIARGSSRDLVDADTRDVVTLVPQHAADADMLSSVLQERFGVSQPEVVGDRVRIEQPAGHELVSAVLGRRDELPLIRETGISRPTLEDVFIRLTGRGLEDR